MVKAAIRGTSAAAITAGGPTQDITISGIGTPKAAFVVVSRATVGGTVAHESYCYGVTDGTFQGGAAGASEDNQGNADTYRVSFDDAIIRLIDPTTAGFYAVATATLITDGIRLSWSTLPATAIQVCVAFWYGTGMTVKCGTASPGVMGAGPVQVTTGFVVDHLMTMTAGAPNETVTATKLIGFAQSINTGSGELTRSASIAHLDNVATMDPAILLETNYLFHSYRADDPNFALGVGTRLDDTTPYDATDGFWVESFGGAGGTTGATQVYLAANYGENRCAIAVVQSAASTGTEAYTGIGFRPQSMIAFGTRINNTWAAGVEVQDSEAGSQCMGFADESGEWSVSTTDEDNAATSNTASTALSEVLRVDYSTGAIVAYQATLDSFDPDGFTLNYSVADPGGDQFEILVFLLELDPITGTATTESGGQASDADGTVSASVAVATESGGQASDMDATLSASATVATESGGQESSASATLSASVAAATESGGQASSVSSILSIVAAIETLAGGQSAQLFLDTEGDAEADVACTKDLQASYSLTTDLVGSRDVTAALDASRDVTAALDASRDVATDLEAGYNSVANLEGGICSG